VPCAIRPVVNLGVKGLSITRQTRWKGCIVLDMNSTENAYTDITWTTHLIGVFRSHLRRGEVCPVAHARLIKELALAEAALATMKAK
jgi:hypothetical protein